MKALVLDFDGVVSDSAREAFVVALRTHCALRPRSPLCQVLPRVELDHPERAPLYPQFLEAMPLGNRAEDYAVALLALEQGVVLLDQAHYDDFKARQDEVELRAFHRHFYQLREEWCRDDRPGWLRLMRPYPELVELLRRRGRELELAIATSKDRRSVRELLAHYGIAELFGPDRVLDKEAGVSKRAHLEQLGSRLGVPFPAMTFVEDKVSHLEAVASLGVRCVLAAWGYNGRREQERARRCGFAVATLRDLERTLFGRDGSRPGTQDPAPAPEARPAELAWGRMTQPRAGKDRGLTHVALLVTEPEASIDFYARYARMKVVHRRRDENTGREVLWLSDVTRPFVVVLIQAEQIQGRLDGFAHLGVGCESREEVDRLCALARDEGRLKLGPLDSGYPVGYWAFIEDPDGHNLEISYGQEVGLTVEDARERQP